MKATISNLGDTQEASPRELDEMRGATGFRGAPSVRGMGAARAPMSKLQT
jgi:hypothetical protein